MSLINKMLQDLEDRGPEATGSDSLHPSIQLAPARRRKTIHPAWFIAAASTVAFLLAVGGFSWNKMRSRIAEIPLIVQQAQLPLKMADRLSVPVSQPDENLIQSSPVPQVAVTSAELSPPAVNPSAKANSGESRTELPKADAVTSELSSTNPKMSVRFSAATDSSAKKMEGSMPEERKETERRTSGAEPGRKSSAETARASAGNDLPAAAVTKQVHELSPHEKAENEYRKAGGLIQQGHSAEAIASLEQALTLDPRHVGARQALIGLLLNARRIDDAMTRAKDGLALDGTQTGLAIILARLQVEKNDLQGAIGTLQRTLPASAENPEYQAFYAALMQRAGNHKEAIAHYEVALRSMPQNGVWWMGMGISLQAEERFADAKSAYIRAKSSGDLSPALVTFIDQRLGQLHP